MRGLANHLPAGERLDAQARQKALTVSAGLGALDARLYHGTAGLTGSVAAAARC